MTTKITFLIMGLILTTTTPCRGTSYIDSIVSSDQFSISDNSVISENAVMDVDRIDIEKSVYLENHGEINGDIFICDECEIYIRNSGTINGRIHGGPNSKIIQTIQTADDLTYLNYGQSGFSIMVQATEEIYLSDIMRLARGADKIILNNTSILLGENSDAALMPMLMRFFNEPTIELVGEITIKLSDLGNLNGQPILSNVSGDGIIRIDAPELDPLYIASTYVRDGNMYVQIIRETDYVKILGDRRGHFLNSVRKIEPDNKTIAALDRADSMAALNDIVNRSVMFNPIKLMRPVKLFNQFEMNSFDRRKPSNSSQPELGLESIYITNDGLTLKAGKASAAIKIHNLDFTLSTYAGYFDQTGDLNEFSGVMYGGNIQTYYDARSLLINAKVGFTFSKFETGFLFDGNGITQNPYGLSFYGTVDFGTKYDLGESISIAPYLGAVTEYDQVLNQSDTSVLGRIGTILGFNFDKNGIRSEYQILMNVQTDGTIGTGIGMFFWSSADQAGGGVSYNMIKDEIGLSHEITIDAHFVW